MLSLIKYFSIILLIFYSYNLFAYNNSVKEEWHEIVKEYYLDYETGLIEYKNKNYNKAFKIFLNLAISGDARAQSDIAGMYFNGWGVNVDHKRAFYWYKKASKNGNPYAQYKLGDMYWNGFGVDINTDTAQIWWKKAADNGYKDAQFNLPYQYCHLNKPQCQ